MKQEILKKVQNYQIEILDEVVRICQKHGLQYFIIAGNLIGAIRHKGFIPWDDDIDIAMMREDYNKFLRIASEEIDSRFLVDYVENNENYYLPFAKIRIKDSLYEESVQKSYQGPKGIWIDIFPLDNASKEDSVFIRFQTFLKECIHLVNAIKANVTSEKYRLFKKIIKFIFAPISIKSLARLQQRIMQWNSNKKASYCINFGMRKKAWR